MTAGADPDALTGLHCTRVGAAHRRQGRPCQDFSLSHRFQGASGEPLLLLVVADGHGGTRYERSERGSRLACELAVAEVERALGWDAAPGPLPEPPSLQWLAEELPATLHHRWLEAIAADWAEQPGPAAFSPLSYGTTLGLVLIGPHWWGHTGLGDWDLVRVEADGRSARLVSEEPAGLAAGEATCSLCQREAAQLFAPRSALHPRRPAEAFALVLSSDGIRKSCASDADFLALAAHLAAMAPDEGPALAAALDQISGEGSGDDVSVAIAQLGTRGQRSPAPEGEPTTGPEQPRDLGPTQGAPRARPPLDWLAPGLAAAAAGLALGAVLVLLRARLQNGANGAQPLPAGAEPLTPALQASLRRSIHELCAQPASLAASLRQRQRQLTDLAAGRVKARQLQQNAPTDPLGALIGTAFQRRGQPHPLADLGACPELEAALAAAWPPAALDTRMESQPAADAVPAAPGPAGTGGHAAPPP